MSNENSSIHDFELDLICEYYSSVERQGPGSPEITKKALSFIEGLSPSSQIVDLGCGTGGQTMVLGAHTEGNVQGFDLFPTFIDTFNTNAKKLSLEHRVKGIVGSMNDLPFQEKELDLIWSEGAIYNIGFENGLKEWHKYLKKDGYIAVSEVSWFTKEQPREIYDFWMDAYPEIDTIPTKVKQMQNAGYIPIATFVLPNNCWTEHFYQPLALAEAIFLEKHNGNKIAEDFVANQRHEAKLYHKYKDFYGYAFYIGKKI